MPETTIYHLNPRSAFHFGVRGLEQEKTGIHFPSDSMFAALLSAWMELGIAPETVTDLFPQYPHTDKIPPFALTSVFPRAGTVRFYPIPPLRFILSAETLDALNRSHRLKEVKKIQFISEELFLAATAGQRLDEYLPSETPMDTDTGWYMQGGALWLTKEEASRLPARMRNIDRHHGSLAAALQYSAVWKQGKVPRVTVDRVSNASQIYFTGRLRFNHDCGLWFGVYWEQPEVPITPQMTLRQAMKIALDVLGDSGIGAERSAGYGQFSVQEELPPKFRAPEIGEKFITLSRFHPANANAVFRNDVSYNLETVAGWVRSPVEAAQRRRRIRFIKEGSVLQYAAKILPGSLVDVRPKYGDTNFKHPVWRYGIAFPVAFAAAGRG